MWSYVVILPGVVTTGLFASSFNRNSLHALLMTGVLIFVGALAIRTAFSAGTFAVWDGLDLDSFYYRVATSDAPSEALRGKTWTAADNLWTDRITLLTVVVGAGGFLGLAMGHRNHRSAEAPRVVLARQVACLLAYAIICSLVVGAGQPLLQYFLITH
jgi:hypothetical protein